MTLEKNLLERSGARCELCSGTVDLGSFAVTGASSNAEVLLCRGCRDLVDSPTAVDLKRWHGLNEAIWSEHAAVKVLAYRVLKKLGGNAWAQDLLGQMYLDDEQQAWADTGLQENPEDAPAKTVDSNGTVLQDGDTVTLIKDLEVKGANFTAKRGTVVKAISLTDDPRYIEGKVNGTQIVLVAAYLKKA